MLCEGLGIIEARELASLVLTPYDDACPDLDGVAVIFRFDDRFLAAAAKPEHTSVRPLNLVDDGFKRRRSLPPGLLRIEPNP